MTYHCQRCGRQWDDPLAVENELRCTRKCGGELAPVSVPAEVVPSRVELPATGQLPYPMALTAGRLQAAISSSADILKALFALKDCFEATIKYLGVILLTEYVRSPACTPEHSETLLEKMVRPSLGVWVSSVVGDLSRWVVADASELGRRVAGLFVQPPRGRSSKAQPTALLKRCEEFVTYRNDTLGHGAARRDSVYRKDLEAWLPVLRQLLDDVAALDGWRLLLVTDCDRCQVWMGSQPGRATEAGEFNRAQIGHFLLRGPKLPPATVAECRGQEVRDLYPFLCYVPDVQQQHRLHFYDSLYRYQEKRKEVQVLEYDEGFKRVTPDPVAGLEETFTQELLSRAFGRHRGRMEVIEGRVTSFSELLAAHADIVGRRFVIDHVKRFIEEHDRGLLVIEAEPGKGKTALLCHLIENEFGHFSPLPVHFFYRRTAGITDPDVCVRSLYASLLETHGIEESEESKHQRSPEEMFTKLVNLLTEQIGPRLSPSRPQLIFLDGLDESEVGAGGRMAYQRIPENLPVGVYVIATTRPVYERASLARRAHLHWYNMDSPDLVQANLRDGQDYVRRELAGSELPNETLEEIGRVGHGNFLVLKLLCGHVRTRLEPVEVRGFLARLAAGNAVDQLGFIYEEFWSRITARASCEEREQLSDVAGLLITVRAAVTAELVCDALKLRAVGWDLALRRLVEYLTVIRYDEDGASDTFYRVYHESFADFLRAKLATDRTRYHRLLGDHCLRWTELPEGYGRLYALRFGPTHLLAARRWDELETLLTDIVFLEAKTQHGMVFDLASDFSASIAALPDARPQRRMLRLLEEALRRDIHFIDRHAQDYPQGLFQCLWNSCWWYDCPDAARYYPSPTAPLTAQQGKSLDAPDHTPGLGSALLPLNNDSSSTPDLHVLLERWRNQKEQAEPGFPWLRALRPPRMHLGSAQLAVLRGHMGAVHGVSVSPGGDRIASAEGRGFGMAETDCTVRLWDARSGVELAVLRGHRADVNCVAFSPDGQRIVSGSNDKTVRVWHARSGAELAVLRGHQAGVRSVAFSPDGERIVTGGNDNTVRVWDVGSSAEMAVLQQHQAEVNSVAFSPDGQRIVSGSNDKTVRVWHARSGAELAVLRRHKHSVMCVAFSPDGERIVSGSAGRSIAIWDSARGVCLAVLRGHEGQVNSVAFSPDGERIVTGGNDNTVRVWDAGSGATLVILRGHEHYVRTVAFSPDGERIVSGSLDKTVRVWDARGREESLNLLRHEDRVFCVDFSPDGTRIGSGSGDKTVRVWDVANGAELAVLRGHGHAVTCMAFSPDGERIVSGALDKTVRVWDARSGTPLATLHGHEAPAFGVAFSPDGQRIVSGSNDKTVRVWHARSGAELAVLRGHQAGVRSVAFSPDGTRIGSGSGDKTVRVWDAASGEEISVLRGHEHSVISVAFSTGGSQIFSGSTGNTVRVWDTRSGECLQVIQGYYGDVRAMAATSQTVPLRAQFRGLESVVERADNGEPIAWWPAFLLGIVAHPSGHTWAGSAADCLCLITLERARQLDNA